MSALILAHCGEDEPHARLSGGTGGTGGLDGGIDSGVDAKPDAGSDAGIETPFDAWRLLRDAANASPDNLPAQAQRLILSKDAEAIFRFVRDNIRTVPTPSWATTGVRWGTRATLRGGAGTPRERAELLAWLYQQAGFESEVVWGFSTDALAAPDAINKIYARKIALSFEPGEAPAPFTSWTDALGPSALVPKQVDVGAAESGALGDSLIALLPASAQAKAIDVNNTQVPLVKVTVGGTVKYANPLLPDAVFGTPYASNPIKADPAEAPPRVKATLKIARSDAPNTHIDVASAEYGLDELTGRQLLVKFSPPEPVQSLLSMRLDQLQVFIPFFALSAIDLTKEQSDAKAVVGNMITSGGDLIETSSGQVSINGVPLDQSKVDPAAAAKVASVKLELGAQMFPNIELLVSALDSSSKPVAGLAAGAFTVEEDGAPMQLFLRQNGGDLRILFLIDETLSQPTKFINDVEREQGLALGQALFAAFPGAKCQVQAIGGNRPSRDGFTLTDAASLAAAFKAAWSPTQPYYEWLAEATKASPSVIVLFTDGIISEDAPKIPAFKAALATGAPVLTVGTSQDPTKIERTLLQEIATLTSGSFVDAGDSSNLAPVNAAIAAIVQKRAAAPYRLSYRAPKAGAATRNVTLGVRGSTAKTSGTYNVPAAPQPERAVCGLHLELQIGNAAPVLRTLAGWSGPGLPQQALQQSVFDDVRAALFGTTVVSFEGGAPSLSTWISDLLSAALLGEPLYAATQSNDLDQFAAALGKTQSVTIPTELAAIHTALASPDGSAIFEQNPRVVLLQLQPNSKANRRMDILPFTRFGTMGAADNAQALRTTLRATARLAILEQALYKTSTAAALTGKPLKFLPPFGVDPAALSAFPQDRRAAFSDLLSKYWNYHRVIASDGTTEAFWAIDADNGSLLGILPDASGGGSSGGCKDFSDVGKYFELLELLNEILSIPGASLWLVLGKFVAVAAIEAAMCFTDGPIPPGFGDIGAFGCGFLEAGLGELAGKALPELGNKAVDFVKNFGTDKAIGSATKCPPMIPKC